MTDVLDTKIFKAVFVIIVNYTQKSFMYAVNLIVEESMVSYPNGWAIVNCNKINDFIKMQLFFRLV